MATSLDSIDDILNSVDSFIEDVYRDLSITPPQRSFNCSSRNTLRRSPPLFDTSSSSATSLTTSPMGAIGGTLSPSSSNDRSTISPTTHRNTDADIERINRICDNVDQNLRSIGLFKNNDNPRNNRETNKEGEQNLPVEQAGITTTSTPSVMEEETMSSHIERDVVDSRPPQGAGQRKYQYPISAIASQVIDLCDSLTQTPEVIRQPDDDDDEDDVVIVSSNISPVINLCTPCFEEPYSARRSNVIQSQLRRRRLAEAEYDIEQTTAELRPPIARRRRTRNSLESTSTDQEQNTDDHATSMDQRRRNTVSTVSTAAQPQKQNDSNISTTTAAADHRTPFMCPVCMDSCLQRQPTSTKCGHVFCEVCIKRAIRLTHKCPMCNTKIANTQIFRIYL